MLSGRNLIETRRRQPGVAALTLLALALSAGDAGAVPARAEKAIALGTGRAYRFKGMAMDAAAGLVYLASWDGQRLVAVDLGTRAVRPLTTKYDGRLNALGVHLRGGRLYAVMNEIDDRSGVRALSVLVVLDAASGKVLRSFELRGAPGRRHHFNHVVVDDRGTAYISDTLQATIHAIDTAARAPRWSRIASHRDLGRVHGIDLSPDGTWLFATSYAGGIRFFHLGRRAFAPYRDLTTAGDDGLAYHEGALYTVGRGAVRRHVLGPAGNAVVRSEVLLADHPLFNDPRDLHIEDGRLYCLANIELDRASTRAGGPVRPPLDDSHIVVMRLDP